MNAPNQSDYPRILNLMGMGLELIAFIILRDITMMHWMPVQSVLGPNKGKEALMYHNPFYF